MSFYDDYLKIRQRNSSADEERKKRSEQASAMVSSAKSQVHRGRQERYAQMSDREKLSLSLAERKRAQQDFLDSDGNVSFFDALTTGKTLGDWVDSRRQKNKHADAVSDASAALTAYDEMQKRKRISSMSYDELEGEIASLEGQIQKSKEGRAGAFDWLVKAFGGDTSGAVRAFDDMIEGRKQRAPLESQLSSLRSQRDEKKSEHVISQLPSEVVALLDEYNSLDYDEDGFDFSGLAAALTGQSGGGTNTVQYSANHLKKTGIAKKLTDMGYGNFAVLAEYRKYLTDKAASQESEEYWRGVAAEHPALAEMGAVATSAASAVSGLLGGIKQLESTTDLSGNPYSADYSVQNARNAVRETIAGSFESGFISRSTKAKLYQALASGADSMATGISFGGLGLGKLTVGEAILGLNAANESYTSALKNGYTAKQAILTGTVAFAAETLWEHFTLGKLSIFEDSAEHTVKAAVGNLLKNSFTNMTEEMATEVTNIVYDYMANGGVSEFYQTYEGYIKDGMNETEAKKQANKDMAVRVADAGLSGALIGGMFSGINAAGDVVGYNKALISEGERIADEGGVDALAEAAAAEGSDPSLRKLGERVGSFKPDEDGAYKSRQLRSIGKLSERLGDTPIADMSSDSGGASGGTDVSEADAEKSTVSTENYSDATIQIRQSLYDGKQSRQSYDADFDLFYNFGKNGVGFEQVKDNPNASSAFTLRHRENAFKAGVNDAEEQSRAILIEVKSIGSDGDAVVIDTKGNQYKLSEFAPGSTQGILYKRAVKTGDTDAANLFVRSFNNGTPIEAYERAFMQFYSAGRTNPTVKYADFIKKGQYGSLVKYFDGKSKAQQIYELGQKKATAPKKKKTPAKAETTAKGEYSSKVGDEESIDLFYTAVAKKLGTDIQRVQSLASETGQEANALFLPQAFKITISATAENEFAALMHELGHVAQEYSPESYQQVREALLTWYLDTLGYKSMEERLRDTGEIYEGMSREEINEEFLNDAIAGLFSSDEGVQDFLRWLQSDSGYSEGNKKSILERIKALFDAIVQTIKDIISTGTLSDTAKDYMMMQQSEAKRIRQMFLSVLDEVSKQQGGTAKPNEPRYSYKGKTADGIEIYEISDEIKALTYSERKKVFHDLMSRQFFGRTAKFTVDGETYYAKFDESSIDKNIFGDTKSSPRGWRAKVSAGADGDIFELIENARYDHSTAEEGKKNASHKKVKHWDYFMKTVQIDGKLYDVLINIRKRSNENLVYSIRLWENKKRVSPTVGPGESSPPVNLADQHSNESIVSQGEGVVNSDADDTRYSFAGKKPNKSLTKGKGKRYNKYIFVSEKEYAMLSSAVMAYNTRFGKKDELKPIIGVNSNDYFYVCENHDSGDFSILARLNPESQMETIKQIREVIKDETFSISEFTSLYAQNDVSKWRDRRRRNNMHLFDAENRRTGQGSGGLYVDQPEHNELSSAGKSDGDTSDEYRHSLKRSLGISESEDRQSLLKKITELEKIRDDLMLQLRHPGQKHILSMTAVQSVARQIKRDYKSTVGVHELSDALYEVYSLIANDEGVAWDIVDTHLTAISDMVLSNSKHLQSEISEESKAILRDIRSVKISLSERQKAQVGSVYGSYNNFRKKAMGSLVLSNEGTELDSRWSELCTSYPWLFSEDVSDADQPLVLMEIIESLRDRYSDEDGFDMESAADYLKAQVYEQYFSVPETKLLSEQYAQRLTRAKVQFSERLRQARADYKAELQRIREKSADEISIEKARMDMRVNSIHETVLKEKKRSQIIRQVRRLDTMLRNPTNQKNIPEGFQSAVLKFCEIFTQNTSVFSYRELDRICMAYDALRANSPTEETSISGSYDFEISAELRELKELLDGRRLSQLDYFELEKVFNIASHFATVVKNETEIFLQGKKEKFTEIGETALEEITASGIKKKLKLPKGARSLKDAVATNSKTPVYFFEDVGGVLEKLYKDIRMGQDEYVRSLTPAKKFFADAVEKYGMKDTLGSDVKREVRLKNGSLYLTDEQLMLIYATAKREALSGKESKHLLAGGIVFENDIEADEGGEKPWKYTVSDFRAHQLTLEDIMNISAMLTDEQKGFADTLVGYLSRDMAMLGNEVSMELYGVRKFKERYYIPFNSAESFGYRKFAEQSDARLKAMSFTKSTVKGAATPLVLSDFTKVWADHVERMSAYNAMVIPLENFTRVWNYKTQPTETEAGKSVASAFETAFGEDAVSYIIDLMRDLNGNIMTDKREDFATTLITKFKKNAVFASLSVMVQQPSAIGRAMALVDPKYFAKTTFTKRDYEEVKKYAPVAVLKEVGGFDTTSGRNMSDWLTETKPENFKDKIKAFFSLKDSSYRDEWLGKGPQFADEITWCHIFNAVKAQTKAQTGLTGEELMWETGKRFSEVIDRTQVYDSVIVKSGLMRSKSKTLQMTTAFMAEPTVSLNMLADAVRQGKKGNRKYFSRALGGLFMSTLINAMLKSVITAMRDDDEDKSLFEKYIGQFVGNFINDAIPLAWIPFVKDVWSICNGYTAEKVEMSLITDLWDAIEKMMDDDTLWTEKLETFAGAAGAFLGVPVKNVTRDVKAIINTFGMLTDDLKPATGGIEYAIASQLPRILETFHIYTPKNKAQRLYDYWVSGDATMYNRVAKEYTSGTAIKNALKGEIKNRFLEGDLSESQVYTLLSKLGYDENKTYYTLRDWQTPEDTSEQEDEDDSFKTYEGFGSVTVEESSPSYSYLHDAISGGDISIIKQEGQDLLKRGAEKEKIRASLTSKWKSVYLSSSHQEKVSLRQKLYATGAYENLAQLDEYLARWEKSK